MSITFINQFKGFSIILFLIYIIRSIQQSVSYDFQILKRKIEFESNLYLSLLSIDDFCIGTPYQCQKILFDPGVSFTMILNKEINTTKSIEGSYSKSFSSTYQSTQVQIDNKAQKLMAGYSSLEKVKFGQFEMKEYPFILTNQWINEIHYSCIGLAVNKIEDAKYNYFINKLYGKEYIKIRQYRIELLDDSRGTITFGDIDVNNSYEKLFQLNHYSHYYVTRFYSVNKISIGEDPLEIMKSTVHLDESFGFVQMPSFMKQQIVGYYLNDNDCKENIYYSPSRKKLKINFSYFLCAKSILDTYNKRGLFFDLKEGIIQLREEDFFIKYDSYNYIFAIIFKNDHQDPLWVIGEPLLKRYMLIRNYDNNTVEFYQKRLKTEKNKSIYFLLLFLNVILVFSSCLMGYIIATKVNNLY